MQDSKGLPRDERIRTWNEGGFLSVPPQESLREAEPEPRFMVSQVELFTEGQGLPTCLTPGTEKKLMAGAGGVITHKLGSWLSTLQA